MISNTFKPYKFIIIFYTFYLIIALLGNLIIDYIPLNPEVFLLYLVYSIFLTVGSLIAHVSPKVIHNPSFAINIKSWVLIFLVITTASSIVSWIFYIHHFGSLRYILLHGYLIRKETMGQTESISPGILGYVSSLTYGIFIIILIKFRQSQNKVLWVSFAVWAFLIIMLNGLRSFGRTGILFAIFSIVSSIILYKVPIIRAKNIFLMVVLFFGLNLPRLMRGGFDNFSSTVTNYYSHFKVNIPPIFNAITSVYIYYFSSLYSFSYMIENDKLVNTYGLKTFAPIKNFISRFLTQESRIILIEPKAYIPFSHNIYSIIKDLLSDFGYFGIIIFPIFLGIFIGHAFKYEGIFFDALKITIMAGIFYSPIYNVFSFGSYFISLMALIFCAIIFKDKELSIHTN